MPNIIDLHTHTTCSDGTYTPSDLVILAKKEGLRAVAITDHDTISGVEEAVNRGNEIGIEVIPGVELSVEFEREIHILGLYIDYKSEKLHNALKEIMSQRNQRNPKIISKLNEIGIAVTFDEVKALAHGEVVGRAHIAKVLVQKGYTVDMRDAFEKYLRFGAPAYCKRDKISPSDAISLIKGVGGAAILAHPGHLKKSPQDLEKFIIELKQIGLDGIEVFHSDHNDEIQKLLQTIAMKNKLLISGGSDFHGDIKKDIKIGVGFGNLRIDYKYLEEIKKSLSI